MSDFERILVVSDRGRNPQWALQRVIAMAGYQKASIHLVGFVYDPVCEVDDILQDDEKEVIRTALHENKESFLKEEINQCNRSNLDFSLSVVWSSNIHQWVNDEVVKNSYDLVVKSVGNPSSLTYTSTDWHLMRECPAPVLIVVETEWRKADKVLATVDLSSDDEDHNLLNQKVLKAASDLAMQTESELHCCFSYSVPKVLSELAIIDVDEYSFKAKDKYKPLLQSLVMPYRISEAHTHLLAGKPEKTIRSLSDRTKVKMVVLGTVARKGLKGMLMGNTAEKLLNNLNCDVLVVKPAN